MDAVSDVNLGDAKEHAKRMSAARTLIAELRAAQGPSLAQDMEITRLLGERGWQPYTSSLDAAVSLVPEGCRWELHSWGSASCVSESHDWHSAAFNPAISLSIAALSARFGITR